MEGLLPIGKKNVMSSVESLEYDPALPPERPVPPPKLSDNMRSIIKDTALAAHAMAPAAPVAPAPRSDPSVTINTLEDDDPDDHYDHDDMVQSGEAAEIIGFKSANLWPLMKRGIIPFEKRRGRLWFHRSVCETISALRKEHPRDWTTRFVEGLSPGELGKHAVNFDEGILGDMMYEARRRASKLHLKGNSAAAMELILFSDWMRGDEI